MTDLQTMGAPAEVIERYRLDRQQQAFDVLPENWDAVDLFLRCQSQWRYAPSGHPTGLDYAGVDVVMTHMQLTDTDTVFEQIQTMEIAYLNQLTID